MILTVEEAKKKWCCEAMHEIVSEVFCGADKCMAWRWLIEDKEIRKPKEDSCDWCDNEGIVIRGQYMGDLCDCTFDKIIRVRFRGYCGLAGKPE